MARAKATMESESKSDREESPPVVALETDSPKEQLAWAQYLHDAQYFDLSSFSPKGLSISPRSEMGAFPDLGMLCPSPLFSDQLKFLQTWSGSSPKVLNNSNSESQNAPVVAPPVPDQVKLMQSLDLARVSNSQCVSTSVSCDSDPCSTSDLCKVGTSESTGSGDEAGKGRKRKSVERDEEINDGSEGDDMEGDEIEVENRVHKSIKQQQKLKGPKRLREPRYSIKTRTEVDIMDDGYKWRKYGQKPVKNSPHPRNYYRCTTANCPVRKRVERSTEDPGLVVTSYEGTHTHPKVTQPKRSPSANNYAPCEPAESLSEALNQLNNRQQQQHNAATTTTTTNSTPPLPPPNLSQLFPGWQSLMNRQAIPPLGQDNVGLMMAYQIVRLQWELQVKVQQFMSYNAHQGFGGSALPKMNPFMNPFMDPLGPSSLPDFNGLLSSYAEGSESEEFERHSALPKVPEALMSGSLLSRRALRTGSPLNPNLQNVMKMQQLMSQAMAGFHHQAPLDQQESLGEIADQGFVPERRS